MKTPVALLAVIALAVIASAAHAAPRALRFVDILRPEAGDVTVPPEWDGVWASEDSIYDCSGVLQSVETYLDTLCSGQVVSFADESPDPGINIVCTSAATATTVNVSCTGSVEVIPDCTVTYSVEVQAVRTGNSFVGINTTEIQYSGTAFGCDFFPESCTRVVTHATRTGPAPSAYCSTPARPQTWGTVKVRYR